jgi:hypothetical protein
VANEPKQVDGTRLPAFFYRLSAHAQRTYLKSDAIDRFEFAATRAAIAEIEALITVLEGGNVTAATRAVQTVASEVCGLAGVSPLTVEVRAVRPRNARGELHGLFYPADRRRHTPPRIILWMRTAVHRDVVKPKTFVRTLMHELVHYFDYALLRLDDSYHTQGFFRRESYLVRALFPSPPGSDD